MLLGTLGAGLLGNILGGKEMHRAGLWVFNEKQGFLIPPHLLTNFEI